jgi:predicted 3-demethylubiquinone-9 3-methyltransferase (glyoxalase superfamily)
MPNSCLPFLMFTGEASQALDFYARTFPGAEIEAMEHYGEGEAMPPTAIKSAVIVVAGQRIRAFDSPPVHAFTFTPSISFFVECASEDELRSLAARLPDGGQVMMPLDNYGFSHLFAWVADRFGVSWQLNLT